MKSKVECFAGCTSTRCTRLRRVALLRLSRLRCVPLLRLSRLWRVALLRLSGLRCVPLLWLSGLWLSGLRLSGLRRVPLLLLSGLRCVPLLWLSGLRLPGLRCVPLLLLSGLRCVPLLWLSRLWLSRLRCVPLLWLSGLRLSRLWRLPYGLLGSRSCSDAGRQLPLRSLGLPRLRCWNSTLLWGWHLWCRVAKHGLLLFVAHVITSLPSINREEARQQDRSQVFRRRGAGLRAIWTHLSHLLVALSNGKPASLAAFPGR